MKKKVLIICLVLGFAFTPYMNPASASEFVTNGIGGPDVGPPHGKG
ncbi:hypothetical protein MHZ92_20450 [Sporosarcina sp. ACRSL]|nr:hypothetical protein [Sporosarcina sp. ACRSL]MCG7346479.1 hypothetical protein [Sporosarcina sp. ACRSL]